jgi:hypothetical protein
MPLMLFADADAAYAIIRLFSPPLFDAFRCRRHYFRRRHDAIPF